jgi:diguanylate cyclase (GGDEF)-like protein
MTGQLKVLIVEDSEDDAILLVRILRQGGYEPKSLRVDTGEAMTQAFQDHSWDVVITDHNMPGFSSEAAIKVVQKIRPDLPVIIVSGSIGEDVAVAAMKMGAQDYIMKDNLARLVPAIERELREAELRRSHRVAEATIRHLAYHDQLTGLVNRNEFDRHLKNALESAKQEGQTHALLYLDLDQFKIINDTCGHQAGDELLSQLSLVLRERIRANDVLARLGGDEFGLLLESCPLNQARQLAENIREAISSFRFVWHDKSFSIGVSIGISVITENSRGVEEILSTADMACYTAKDLGRNRVHIYMDDDSELLRRQDEMQWALWVKDALEEERFILHCQKIIPLNGNPGRNNKTKDHFEFLLRMNDGADNIIMPGAFIPAAERYGIMPSVDRWVVNAVIEYLAGQQAGRKGRQGVYFVNLSGASLSDSGFFEFIKETISRHHLQPGLLCFEITETAAIANLNKAVGFIKEIRRLGCRFALDDFGSGLSSFSYLKEIPVDYLKIDGSFVRDMVHNPMNHAIVKAINEIGHVAGLYTIAEYVEDSSTLDELRGIGVDLAQGYGISKPQAVSANMF